MGPLGTLHIRATVMQAGVQIPSRWSSVRGYRSVKEPSLSLMLLSWPFIGELAYQSSLAVSSTSLFTTINYVSPRMYLLTTISPLGLALGLA